MQTNKLFLAFEHTVSNEMKTCEIYEQSVQNLCVTNQRQWADISFADLRIANNHFECIALKGHHSNSNYMRDFEKSHHNDILIGLGASRSIPCESNEIREVSTI